MSDGKADLQELADLLADPEIREIWEQELWQAFVDPLIRRRFEKETGLGRQESTGDPLHGFTDASERENDAYAWAFAQWFNERCWSCR